ncbi:MAG TPA: FkbM family methyltransferase [Opitutaceae bacterium]|nr:FkbM family methyltransferase [Opitutaceae bacterium]
MKLLRKARTAFHLLRQGEPGLLRRQAQRAFVDLRVRWHGGRPFVHRAPGFPSVCHPDWPDSVEQLRDGQEDAWEFSLLKRWLERGDTVIDVGANSGLYSFAAATTVGVSGRVVAIDADPLIVERLRTAANLLGATQLEPLHAAISDAPGQLRFFVRTEPTLTGQQSLRPTAEQRAASREIVVPALTLQAIGSAQAMGRLPAAVKIDIEGAESAALRGGPAGWFSPDGPLWIVEVNPGALAQFDTTPQVVLGFFPAAHFERWLAAKHPHAGNTAVLRAVPHDDLSLRDSMYYNLIAVPKGASRHSRRERIAPLLR